MRSTARSVLGLVAILAAACVSACGSSADAPASDSNTFLAFPSTFQGYRSWQSFTLPATGLDSSPHTAGTRTVFLKQAPPHGATSFPTATVIVKEMHDSGQILAMVKRGGDYNASGAVGWEWFELLLSDSGTTSIKWRGVGPPLGEVYGGDPNGGCNGCHGGAKANDFVQDASLKLSNF